MARKRKRRAFGTIHRVKRNGKVIPGYYVSFTDPRTGRRTTRKGGDTEAQAEKYLAKVWAEADALGGGPVQEIPIGDFAHDVFFPLLVNQVVPRHFAQVVSRVNRAALYFGGRLEDEPARYGRLEQDHDVVRGGLALASIGRQEIDAYMAALQREGLSPATQRKHASALGRLWGEALEARAALENPLAGIARRLRKPREFEPVHLSAAQVRKLCAAIPANARPLVTFLAETGARLGEAISLTWSHVVEDFSTATFINTKSARTKTVPLTSTARELLRGLHNERGAVPLHGEQFVFPSPRDPGRPISASYVQYRFKQTCKRIVLPERTRLHDLRHAVGAHLAAAGVPLNVIADILGHRSLRVTERYSRFAPASAAVQAVAAMERVRGAALGGGKRGAWTG